MARAYYGSRFSANMTKTPEGFLICHNVPIARTGTQKYLSNEIGLEGNDLVIVYRVPDEVFAEKTVASFEGKVFTDEHPYSWVNPENVSMYSKGVVTNVRRGGGADSDLLLADVIVHNQDVIEKIQNKKREVSCGYECEYEKYKDGYKQVDIIGNHVSLVDNGRAGERVAIKDTQLKEVVQERSSNMQNYKLPSSKPRAGITEFLKAVGLKAVVQDSEPEDILNVVDELAQEKSVKESEVAVEKPILQHDETDEVGGDEQYAELEQKIDKALSLIESLLSDNTPPTGDEVPEVEEEEEEVIPEMDELEDLEDELLTDGDMAEEEESVTVDPDEIDVVEDEEPIYGGSEVFTAQDSALELLRQFKPIIAAIPDKKERRKATDALVKQVRRVANDAKSNSAYVKMTKRQQSQDTQNIDKSYVGKEIAEKFNPHYKKNK